MEGKSDKQLEEENKIRDDLIFSPYANISYKCISYKCISYINIIVKFKPSI